MVVAFSLAILGSRKVAVHQELQSDVECWTGRGKRGQIYLGFTRSSRDL